MKKPANYSSLLQAGPDEIIISGSSASSLLQRLQTSNRQPGYSSPLGTGSIFFIPDLSPRPDTSNMAVPGLPGSASQSLSSGTQFQDEDPGTDKANTIWVTFIAFEFERDLEQFLSGGITRESDKTIYELLESNSQAMPLQMVCAYVKKTTPSATPMPVFRYSKGLCAYITNIIAKQGTIDLYEHIDKWLGRVQAISVAHTGFVYEAWQIEEAFEITLFTNIKTLVSKTPEPADKKQSKELYESNYKRFRAMADNPDDPQTEHAIRLLCKLITDLDTDILKSYNQQNDVRYNTAYPERKLTANDYYHMARRLTILSAEIKKFQNGDFKTAEDVRSFVNSNLVDKSSIGAETKFVINYPFSKLTYEKRKQILSLFLDGETTLSFSGFFRHNFRKNYITYGDIVFNLLITAEKNELNRLIKELDAEDLIFQMMVQSDEEFLQHMVLFISDAAFAASDAEQAPELKLIEGIASGNFFFYNDDDNKSQIAYLGGLNKKIHIENYGYKFELNEEDFPGSQSDDDYNGAEGFSANREEEEKEKWKEEKLNEYQAKKEEYLSQFSSAKKDFSPLDLLVVVAEGPLKDPLFELKQDEIKIVPACVLYAVMRRDKQVRIDFLVSVSLFLIFLPVDFLALANAIKTANTLGVLAYRTDIAVNGINVVASLPEIREGMPGFTEFVNNFTFFYGLARFGYAGAKGLSGLPNSNFTKALQFIAAETGEFIKRFPYKLAGFIINLQKKEIQMAILNKLLVVFASDGKVLFKMNPEGIIVEMKLVTGAENWELITELKNVKIKIPALNGKIVEEHVQLKKTIQDGKIVLKLVTPFKEGKDRPAELINQFFYKSKETPPSMPGTTATDIYLEEGKSFYMVEYQMQGKPGAFAAAEPVFTIADLRNKLAVLKSWKNESDGVLVIRKYTVNPGQKVPVRKSIIGPQEDIINGVSRKYKGGAVQFNFTDVYSGARGKVNDWEVLFKENKPFEQVLK